MENSFIKANKHRHYFERMRSIANNLLNNFPFCLIKLYDPYNYHAEHSENDLYFDYNINTTLTSQIDV